MTENRMFEIEYVDKNTIIFDGERLKRSKKVHSSRAVFFSRDYVIKVDTMTEEEAQRKNEWACQSFRELLFWEGSQGTRYRKNLAPIAQAGEFGNGFFYVVQERLRYARHIDYSKPDAYELDERASELFYEAGLKDNHAYNWMIHKGEIMIVDYCA